ncbi:MAG TPA: MgtC/SapB family protein [Edaphobacter sp.]|nr:MgtC/SapB family protein [Edaphobacter sp.]
MPVTLNWEQIGVRVLLASIASFLIGYNRDERGKALGIRTTMLVCLAATLAMLQANQLMDTTGKKPDSFVVLDLMRFPLGILSGIGFIGAGAILRRDGLVHGITTAATMWYVTVLGLLFGGGQMKLAMAGTVMGLLILWALKRVEAHIPTRRTGFLALDFVWQDLHSGMSPQLETEIRGKLESAGYEVRNWNALYRESALSSVECELRWPQKGHGHPNTPRPIRELGEAYPVCSLRWRC